MFCPSCGLEQPETHRYCVACGTVLPADVLHPTRPKMTALYAGIPTHSSDPPEPVLRVSRYFDDVDVETAEGPLTIPGRHVRLSIWVVDRPVCAISLPDTESDRLAAFLSAPADTGERIPA
jgi:hypothetical protein